MEKNRILQRLFLLSFITMLFCGCTMLLFENPIPNKGEIVQVLPNFLRGKFIKQGEQIFYDIERINERHCIIYATNWIHKDSIDTLIKNIRNDSTKVEFRESTLIIEEKDTSQFINLRLDKDIYYTDKEPEFELNLDKGYFIDNFDKRNKKRAILKFYKNKYFLNIIEQDEKWFAVWIEKNNERLIIKNSVIADTTFVDKLSYYNKLTKIKKIDNKVFLANPTDKELFNLIEEPSLFNEETWIRVNNTQTNE